MEILSHKELYDFLFGEEGEENLEILKDISETGRYDLCHTFDIVSDNLEYLESLIQYIQRGMIEYPNQQLWKIEDGDWVLYTFCPKKIISLIKREIKKRNRKYNCNWEDMYKDSYYSR